ncbi:hypothetical protein N0M98_30625 [Paenibacillus doosanensis]|uniref:hypothetical protein n=1 Tax=Paenibacillus doosanensis TaxID=1229154 RepID=UPI00217FA138|nr:hypothetical protein [Paenibacillus doosanensis]MCS7464457.1 hypothetical protein [Paenibacillus doosanensis]
MGDEFRNKVGQTPITGFYYSGLPAGPGVIPHLLYSITYTDATDYESPSAPTNLRVSDVSSMGDIRLSWVSANDNIGISEYNIYNGSVLIGTSTTTNYQLHVNPDLICYFTVKAKDLAGNISEASNVAVFETIKPTPPRNLINLTQVNSLTTEIQLQWEHSTDESAIAKYIIYNDSEVIDVVPGDINSYWLRGITENKKYLIVVRSVDIWNNPSDFSNMVTFIVDTQAPIAPTNLIINGNVLSWSASSDNIGVTGYEIFNGSSYIGSSVNNSFSLPDSLINANYSFSVKAKDAAGNVSVASNALVFRMLISTKKITYYYDSAGRVNYIELEDGTIIHYQYDNNGNLIHITK